VLGEPKLSIIATMIVTFSLSVAIMLWERRTPQALPAAPPVAPRLVPIPQPAVAPVADSVPPAAEHRAPAIAQAPANTTAVASPQVPTPMPVALQINHNRRLEKVEALMSSVSDVPLSIHVSVMNSNGESTAQLTIDLEPWALTAIGTNEGVQLNPGDQVTLQSPPYQERSQRVP
jgi:hypothetical protein